MRKLKKILVALVVCAIALVGIIFLMLNYGITTKNFACPGELSEKNKATPATVYILLKQFRFAKFFGGDVHGELFAEFPGGVSYYGKIQDVGLVLSISKTFPDKWHGTFSKISKRLVLYNNGERFEGICSEVK